MFIENNEINISWIYQVYIFGYSFLTYIKKTKSNLQKLDLRKTSFVLYFPDYFEKY